MIIGIDASRANREAKTGTEWYSYNLILELAKIDKNNRYFLYSPDKLSDKLSNLPDNFCEKVLTWPPKYLWTMVRMSIEMLKNAPNVLFIPAHIIPLVSPAKTITTIMDVGFIRKPELYPQKELKYHNFGLKQAIKKARKIITISEFSKKEMVELCNIDPDKINVIYLGFDANLFHPINETLKINKVLKKYNIPKREPFFFYVGRLEEKKNIPNLIKAYGVFKNRNPEIKHKLVLGGNPGYNYDKISMIIKEYNLENEVVKTGWIEEDDLPYIFNASFAFIFPSFYEGFGLPLLEAMACGTPIISSHAASIPEITGGAAMLFNPYNIEEIADSMKNIIKNDTLRNNLTDLGFERIKAFSWENCARKTLEIIKSI